jgi:hypothetical protein
VAAFNHAHPENTSDFNLTGGVAFPFFHKNGLSISGERRRTKTVGQKFPNE